VGEVGREGDAFGEDRVAAASPHGEAYADRLRARAQEAAQRGCAISGSGSGSGSACDEGLSAVAVPVTSRPGTVLVSLSLSGPAHLGRHRSGRRDARR
jgi:DNA-binding IclR family transcriptional regulator